MCAISLTKADTHMHLSHYLYDNIFPYLEYDGTNFICHTDGTRESLVDQIKKSGIEFCIEPAIEFESNERVLALSEKMPQFHFSAVGVHPTRTYRYRTVDSKGQKYEKRMSLSSLRKLKEYSFHPSVVAIGETGLDYHLEPKEQHRVVQRICFIYLLQLAYKRKLPVILHIREADHDALRTLRRFKRKLHGGVYHCFSGNANLARNYTDLGLMLGIGGALLTEKGISSGLEEAIRKTPIENLLIETDSPYVKPTCLGLSNKQQRKARNTSLIMPAISKRIAELKGMRQEEVECITTENAKRLFRIV